MVDNCVRCDNDSMVIVLLGCDANNDGSGLLAALWDGCNVQAFKRCMEG